MTDIQPLSPAEVEEMEVFARSHPRVMVSRLYLLYKHEHEQRIQQKPIVAPDWRDGVIETLRAALRPFANLHVEYSKPDVQLYGRATPSGTFHITNADVDHAHAVLDDVGV